MELSLLQRMGYVTSNRLGHRAKQSQLGRAGRQADWGTAVQTNPISTTLPIWRSALPGGQACETKPIFRHEVEMGAQRWTRGGEVTRGAVTGVPCAKQSQFRRGESASAL